MAVLTSSGVTVNETWKEGGTSGRRFLAKEVTLVLSAQGDLTDNIPAALFGMTKIVSCRNFRKSTDSSNLAASPSYDGAYLVFATAETAGTPAVQTGTFKGIVVGND